MRVGLGARLRLLPRQALGEGCQGPQGHLAHRLRQGRRYAGSGNGSDARQDPGSCYASPVVRRRPGEVIFHNRHSGARSEPGTTILQIKGMISMKTYFTALPFAALLGIAPPRPPPATPGIPGATASIAPPIGSRSRSTGRISTTAGFTGTGSPGSASDG